MSAPIRLMRGFLTVGAWTLLSRGVGFARDVMMAAYLGTGPVAEAFLIAFSLPNMFRRFFAEGAFNMAFVPLFAKKIEAGEDARGFAEGAFNTLGAILVAFTVLGTFAMPGLVWLMASGFVGDARFDLAVTFGRISFSYILFISLVALLSGVLNTVGRFTEASVVPVLLNVIFIVAMWLAAGSAGTWGSRSPGRCRSPGSCSSPSPGTGPRARASRCAWRARASRRNCAASP